MRDRKFTSDKGTYDAPRHIEVGTAQVDPDLPASTPDNGVFIGFKEGPDNLDWADVAHFTPVEARAIARHILKVADAVDH